MGNPDVTTIYKKEIGSSPISLLDPNSIIDGVNSVLKDVKKSVKKS